MLISPPFLPPTIGPTDNDWIDAAMPGGIPGHGGYPVSYSLGWHGGIHIQAPGADQSVRAIADGTVVYVRQPTAKPDPVPEDHPLNYRNGWTNDGCVVIKHITEIGANAQNQPTQVTYYSITMHLSSLHANANPGQAIYRKDEIGMAGEIYGAANQIHFEIICDDTNVERLVGRTSGKTNITTHGRTDAVYGEMYLRLPPGTRIYGGPQPADNVTKLNAATHPAVHTLCEPLYIGLRYAGGDGAQGNRGDAYVTTYDIDGTPIGSTLREVETEYNLYTRASKISTAYTAGNACPEAVPAPSAVYELLRFGRVLGPDALTPANTPHWRKINYEGGEGWVNLNAPEVNKFSDADFPHWRGWTLIDDSKDLDSRCDSDIIKSWLDQDGDGKIDPNEAVSRLPHDAIQAKMKRTICKLPTEWEQATVDHRWSWLKEETEENPAPLSDEDFMNLREHIEALAFWEEANIGISTNHWHFHPREFIRQFRRCGWLSLNEMAQLLPGKFMVHPPAVSISWNEATGRFANGYLQNNVRKTPAGLSLAINIAFRKYALNASRQRQAYFFSQIFQETGALTRCTEAGGVDYFRTMYEVITAQEAGADWDNNPGSHVWRLGIVRNRSRALYIQERPDEVRVKAENLGNIQAGDGPRFRGRGLIQITGHVNYTAYGNYRQHNYTTDPNPTLLAGDAEIATDVSLYYWVSKRLAGGVMNINRQSDEPNNLDAVTRAVNGGLTHIEFRRMYFGYAWSIFNDVQVPPDTPTLKRQRIASP